MNLHYTRANLYSKVLLPLDALKIKRQVNPEAFRGRGVVRIFMEEGTTLYRGWGWTMARNAPGSFAVRILSFPLPHLTDPFYSFIALWCFSRNKRVRPRSHRLPKGNMDPKFHRFYRWCSCFHHRSCPARHDQDSDSEC